MAQLKLNGQRVAVSREIVAQQIPQRADSYLESLLVKLGDIENCKQYGLVECSDRDWDEVMGIAEDITKELGFRYFFRSVGIYMEVR